MSIPWAYIDHDPTLIARTSEYTTEDHVKQVISTGMVPRRLDRTVVQPHSQSRVTNILDIPKLAPYSFVEPDYGSREAESMVKSIP